LTDFIADKLASFKQLIPALISLYVSAPVLIL
jgi:hypothetical protein